MRIEVLGPVRLSTGQNSGVEVAERHLRVLLASLVAAEGETVSADVLVDRLWDGDLPANPKKVLRAKLSRLRTVLDRAQPGARDLLRHTPTGYRLVVKAGMVDATVFKDAVGRARRLSDSAGKAEALRDALGLWRGEPYGDVADEAWLALAVAELFQVRSGAVELMVEALLAQGQPEQAIEYAQGTIAVYPARERLVGALMIGLYQVGRQGEALEVFESLRRRLADDLGVDPGPEVRELHGRILRHDSTLASTTTRLTRSVPPRTNVPAETAPLIGRRREIAQIDRLLAETRLVTLTGIGGVGKTRLAVHVAGQIAGRFERGAWFVDLSELTTTLEDRFGSGERIASLMVAAMDLPEQTAVSSDLGRLYEALGSRPVLLVLDNCEHVIVEAALFAADLLRGASGVRVLATSREPLGLPEEHRYNVATLDTRPAVDGGTSEAVEFFAVRARATDPAFDLDGATAIAVSELCRRLDGLPLALELAAGRMRGISVVDLVERLSDRLNLLRRPGRGVPRRQQTLRGMIDWSWSLLGEVERAVLRRLAVHPGTLSLEAAEDICADDPGAAAGVRRSEVVDVLIGLVDRSLVTTVSDPAGVRYGLLESIAAYAQEKLAEAGERDAVARQHLSHYLDLAVQADAQLRGPGQRRWLTRVEAEWSQLGHAFDEAVRLRDGDGAVGLTRGTFWYAWIAGRQRRLSDHLAVALDLPGPREAGYAAAATLAASMNLHRRSGNEVRRVEDALSLFDDDSRLRARVQWFAGVSLLAVGVREAGERHVEQAIGKLAERGEDWDVAVAASQRDWFAGSNWGQAPRGLPDGRDPEQVLRALGDGYGLAQVFAVEYRAAEIAGDHGEAARAAERALEVCADLELWAEASYWFTATAITALRYGDPQEAAERVHQARSIAADVADEHALRFADLAEAMFARNRGDLPRARLLLDAWLSYAGVEAAQDPTTQFEHGFLAVQQGDVAVARAAFRAVSAPIREAKEPAATARLLELAAAIRAIGSAPRTTQAEHSAEMLGTAEALRLRSGTEPSMSESADLDYVRGLLGDHLASRRASAARARGRGLDPATQLHTFAVTASAL